MTVLFADLAGSTALGERLDPEDVRELQGELFELINTEVERYGGTTEKFAGDAVLAVFGIPQAHEDDAERAVRTALAVRDAFGSFTERVLDRHDAEVGLRIGVNTGEVVSGREAAARGELMVSGDAVNVAARLQQHAQPGEVLVGTADAGRDEPGRLLSRARGPRRQGQERARARLGRRGRRGRAGGAAPRNGRPDRSSGRPGRGARDPDRRRRAGRARAHAAARDALRRGGGRQVAPARRARRPPSGRPGHPRALPALRRRNHLLAPGRGGQGSRGHPGQRSSGRRARQAAGRDRVGRARRPSRAGGRGSRLDDRARLVARHRPARGRASPERGLGALRRRPRPRAAHGLRRRGRALGLERAPRPAGAAGGQPRRHAHPARLHGPARAAGEPPDLGSGQAERERPHAGSALGRRGDRADLVAPRREPGAAGRPRAGPGERRGQSVLPRGDADDADRGGRARAPERRLELDAAARGRLDPGLGARRDRRADRPSRREPARGPAAMLRRRPRVLALGCRGRRGRDRLARPQRPRHGQPRLGRRRDARVLVQARAHPRRRVRQPPPPRAARASSPRRRVGSGGGAGSKR